jgi:hypothetical protein
MRLVEREVWKGGQQDREIERGSIERDEQIVLD